MSNSPFMRVICPFRWFIQVGVQGEVANRRLHVFGASTYTIAMKHNSAALATTSIIPIVAASAAEAEYGYLLYNAQLAELLRQTAEF